MSADKIVQSMLNKMSGPMLLKTYAALTHKMHAATSKSEEILLRLQRDKVQEEILRRMGDI